MSLCDYSGRWADPWRKYGYDVVLVDVKHGIDVLDYCRHPDSADVLLMAPPCTDFSVSGAQYWKAKDKDGRTEASLRIVRACLKVKDKIRPRVWALENPVGRLPKLLPRELGRYQFLFNPHEFAGYLDRPSIDAYTKKTCLWGRFTVPVKRNRKPIRVCSQGSWIQKLGGKSEKTKMLRSLTPQGFSLAFCLANLPKELK